MQGGRLSRGDRSLLSHQSGFCPFGLDLGERDRVTDPSATRLAEDVLHKPCHC